MAGTQAQDPIVGLWQLLSFERVSGEAVEAMTQVQGHLLYSADGFFSEAFSITDGSGTTRTVIYGGTYEREDGFVFHIPLHHPDAQQVGQRLQRGVALTSDSYILTSGTPESFVRLTCRRLG